MKCLNPQDQKTKQKNYEPSTGLKKKAQTIGPLYSNCWKPKTENTWMHSGRKWYYRRTKIRIIADSNQTSCKPENNAAEFLKHQKKKFSIR